MYKKLVFFTVLLAALVLSACGSSPTPTAAAVIASSQTTPAANATATIDPCQPKYARMIAEKVNSHMREFDDASTLAVSVTADKLPGSIAELQRIRRASQDEPVPASCLGKLKDLQLGHMNTVINTLLAMLNKAPAADLQTGISNARKLHDAYTVELAKILGITLVAPATSTPGAAATNTPPASTSVPAAAITVSNPGPTAVNLRAAPDLAGTVVAVFALNATTPVLGKSADGKWVQVANPDKPAEKAWLYTQPVKLSGPLDAVPVVTP